MTLQKIKNVVCISTKDTTSYNVIVMIKPFSEQWKCSNAHHHHLDEPIPSFRGF